MIAINNKIQTKYTRLMHKNNIKNVLCGGSNIIIIMYHRHQVKDVNYFIILQPRLNVFHRLDIILRHKGN